MTESTKMLHPLNVMGLPTELKGGDMDIKKGDTFWILRNHNGKYGNEPYAVEAVCDIVRDTDRSYAVLVLVRTHIDDYFDHVGNLDIIGTSREDVMSKVGKINDRLVERRKSFADKCKNDPAVASLVAGFKKMQEK